MDKTRFVLIEGVIELPKDIDNSKLMILINKFIKENNMSFGGGIKDYPFEDSEELE